MIYTTNTTYPITLGTTEISPYYASSTSALPPATSLNFTKEGISIHYGTPSREENKEYICNYCGTRYIDIQGGFIPNCKNCGAKLDKVEGE